MKKRKDKYIYSWKGGYWMNITLIGEGLIMTAIGIGLVIFTFAAYLLGY